MGQTDDIMMKPRPSGYMYTPITRGHKPTPSQESNTLSEVSCTTTLSMDSGPLSPTYREEEEENRLQDFHDEDLTGSQEELTAATAAAGGVDYADDDSLTVVTTYPGGGIGGVSPRLASQPELRRLSNPNLRLSTSNLSERSSTVSGGRGSSVSGLSDVRFRDSLDTVVRVVCSNNSSDDQSDRVTANVIGGMPRDAKSANSDYGSFCATPTGVDGSSPPTRGGPITTTPYQQVQNSSADQIDNSIIAGDLYQREPLLSDSETEDEPSPPQNAPGSGGGGGGSRLPTDRGAPVKLTVPPGSAAGAGNTAPSSRSNRGDEKIPNEPLKTLLAGLFLGSGFVATTSSLAITHESVPDIDPLPDVILDHVAYQQWGLDVSEILIMISTITAFLVVIFHFHRFIILRRIFFLLGCLYYYRAITMFITVLPKADPSYTCNPKLDNTTALPALVIIKRVLILISGMGLSINGKHIYCGDYIFSGHTMVLTMGYLVIKEYSPRRFFVLHWLSFLTSLAGIIMLLIARGHYSIDCLIAYYITTRMWWIYHTLANNNNLKSRGNHNFFDQMWWWLIFRYFEKQIDVPLPRKYNFPLPKRIKRYFKRCFRSCFQWRRRQQQRSEDGSSGGNAASHP